LTTRPSIVLIFLKRSHSPGRDSPYRTRLESSVFDLEALRRNTEEQGPVVILQHIRTYVPKRRPENVVVSTDVFCIDAIFRNESEDSAHPSKGVSVSLGGAILSLGECLASYIGTDTLE
jgi:hypothetical protein